MPSAYNVCDVLSQGFFSWGRGQGGLIFTPTLGISKPHLYIICHLMSLVMCSACNACDVLSQGLFRGRGGGQRGLSLPPPHVEIGFCHL